MRERNIDRLPPVCALDWKSNSQPNDTPTADPPAPGERSLVTRRRCRIRHCQRQGRSSPVTGGSTVSCTLGCRPELLPLLHALPPQRHSVSELAPGIRAPGDGDPCGETAAGPCPSWAPSPADTHGVSLRMAVTCPPPRQSLREEGVHPPVPVPCQQGDVSGICVT